MNALPDFTKRQAELFAIKCTEFADRVAAGRIAFLDAVDLLHDAAVSSGLVEAIGESWLPPDSGFVKAICVVPTAPSMRPNDWGATMTSTRQRNAAIKARVMRL